LSWDSAVRPLRLCRSWLFVDGADEDALLKAAPASKADVLVQELEDFTPPHLRPKARAMAPGVFRAWREAGYVVGVRVNPLEGEGLDDLAAVMRGAPDVVGLPKVAEPEHILRLDNEIGRFEREYRLPPGSTAIWPNIELARGLVQAVPIARASVRTKACLVASEDLAADLGAERAPDGIELAFSRQRFLVDCVAAGVLAVDCPFTWSDAAGVERDARWARRLGYRAKAAVAAEHAVVINRVLTPDAQEAARARRIVQAFEAARERGESRILVDGSMIEVPIYNTMRRLLARADELAAVER
jgi:citrate lyase subunit beta/citryl-CoA lyase